MEPNELDSTNASTVEAKRGGFWSKVVDCLQFFGEVELLVRCTPGFILAAVFFCLPFFGGFGEPWYFWIGSGVIAIAASLFLVWFFFGIGDNDGA